MPAHDCTFTHPTGTNPEETHSGGLDPSRTQLRGTAALGRGSGPLALLAQAVPSRLPPLSHPPQREEGAGSRRSAVGEAAKHRNAGGRAWLGWMLRGREPKPPRQRHCQLLVTPRAETDPWLQRCCPEKALKMGGDAKFGVGIRSGIPPPGDRAGNGWGCKIWGGHKVRYPSFWGKH